MSTFTAVDLSRLPPPALVEPLDFETILAKRIAKFRELFPEFDALTESDPSMIHLQESAYRELVFRQRVNDAAKGGMLAYAVGSDLDHIGARDNITRYMLDPGGQRDHRLRERRLIAAWLRNIANRRAGDVQCPTNPSLCVAQMRVHMGHRLTTTHRA
ncbi:hypothetical protein [Lysobacter capsici]|uniref:hypothetical protein n=1 Tax=Lysobacter capsici TaxID=435897 RepID=UPI001C0050B2|nr:hypothetical protein [Lysobacter capsici]QWF19115.1 hypothetical protein KME82_10440 [Lysobacter capsici]